MTTFTDSQMADAVRPRVLGVSRMADNAHAILVHFTKRPTDDELRALHDRLRGLKDQAAVPREPTETMLEAGDRAGKEYLRDNQSARRFQIVVWQAMWDDYMDAATDQPAADACRSGFPSDGDLKAEIIPAPAQTDQSAATSAIPRSESGTVTRPDAAPEREMTDTDSQIADAMQRIRSEHIEMLSHRELDELDAAAARLRGLKDQAAVPKEEWRELIRLGLQRYQDSGDSLARRLAWALEDAATDQPAAKK